MKSRQNGHRTVFGKVWAYLRRDDRIAPLPPGLVNRFDMATVDPDMLLIMATGYAKDPAQVSRLMEKYGVTTAVDLIPLLPKRKRPSIKKRFRDLLVRIEGGYPSDPHMRRTRKIKSQYGITETRFKEYVLVLIIGLLLRPPLPWPQEWRRIEPPIIIAPVQEDYRLVLQQAPPDKPKKKYPKRRALCLHPELYLSDPNAPCLPK